MKTLAWSSYSDPELLARERERIFARAWQYVGHLGQLGGAGYFASRVGDIPVVITRDRDAVVRAFLNVCRHRGSVVAAGQAERGTLQCPYHAWTYGLDGSLLAAPRADREGELDMAELSLRQVHVDTWGPFVFANPDLDASPLVETLGPLPGLVAEAGDERAGLATYTVAGDACELVTLNAFTIGAGVGGALVEAVVDAARAAGCAHVHVTTTNDNFPALRLYQRHGFVLAALHRGAVDIVRRRKSQIALVGHAGVPIRDELVLERAL